MADGPGEDKLAVTLEMVTANAREMQARVAAAERLLMEERESRRFDLERVLAALGRQPAADQDVRLLAETAEMTARELRHRYDALRRERAR